MPIDPKKTAFLFPGQGSQAVGMGRVLAAAEPAAADVFLEADSILSEPLSKLCWEGPADLLNDTLNTQPALLTHSVAVLRVLQNRLPDFVPAFTAGHSMGEFSALVASGALSFEDALRLVRERGRVMQAAGQRQPGGMAAVLGPSIEVVDDCCEKARAATGGVVQVANDNCPGQVVISGDDRSLSAAIERLQAVGARKVIRLAVSIAAHSPLMTPAQEDFNRAVRAAPILDPHVPVLGNVGANRLLTASDIRTDLEAQLTSRVRWTESVRWMIDAGVDHFIELGTGTVLAGLVRRIDRAVTALSVDEPDSMVLLLA